MDLACFTFGFPSLEYCRSVKQSVTRGNERLREPLIERQRWRRDLSCQFQLFRGKSGRSDRI